MGCAASAPTATMNLTEDCRPIAVFTTNMGTFSAQLYIDKVPLTVSNFIDLAESGFYNGIHFHRVVRLLDLVSCPTCPTGFRCILR